MNYLGDLSPGETLDFKFTTVGVTGAPTTLAGTPVVSCYKSNSTTETTTGVTLTVDFDSRTGMHHVRIDTSADGTFFAAGNDFDVVITTGTVGGTSVVGYIIGHFSLRNRVTAIFNNVVENSKTFMHLLRGYWAVLGNKASGLGSGTATFRDDADSKDRIVATVDSDGNRSAITKDLT